MKRFLNIPLNHKISIYVPGTKDVNKETDNGEHVKKIIGVLSDMFGGATAGEHLGGWRSNSGEIVTEKITIVYAFCNEESLKSNIQNVLNVCQKLKKELSQEAISLEIDNKLYFI